MLDLIFQKIHSQGSAEITANLKRNWYIPISALFFYLLNASNDINYYLGIFISVLLTLLLCALVSDLPGRARNNRKLQIFSLVNSISICSALLYTLSGSDFIWGPSLLLRIISAVLAVPFVYAGNLLFWSYLPRMIRQICDLTTVKRSEWIFYAVLLLLSCALASYAFTNSQAFYGTPHDCDVIYTSDSPAMIRNNVYLALTCSENDIRQPLFAVFSAPFMGIPSLISLIPFINGPLIMDYAQIALLLFTFIMLSMNLGMTIIQRISFVIFNCCTYTYLLSTLMMEQYVIAFFYLILSVCLISGNRKSEAAVCAATGSYLVSGALFTLVPDRFQARKILVWFKNTCKYAGSYLLLILLFGRTDVLINSATSILFLRQFAGTSISYSDRTYQYLNFVRSCFLAPDSGNNNGFWQMYPVTAISWTGIAFLIIAIVGFTVTHKNKMSLLSFAWIIMSALLLLAIGWGTVENGLILYCLYFGWSFPVLLFNLMKHAEEKLKTVVITPVITVISCIVMMIINIPALGSMLVFAVSVYPA
ncbi:MAG: hypothetical protein IKE53_01180 [Clostridiales bacterium]|nr:hypothetical protein [Clostridiales bacterium]